MDAAKLNKQLVEFPISVGLYSEFRNRIWLGLIRAEISERIEAKFKDPKIAEVDLYDPRASYLMDLKSISKGSNQEYVVYGEYIFGLMNAMTGEMYPERVRDLLEVFSEKVYTQVKLSTPEGESPSLLYYSWFEHSVVEMVKSVILAQEKEDPFTVENIVANLKCLANSGKRVCHTAVNNINFRDYLISILPDEHKHIITKESLNRGLIIYENIMTALNVRAKPGVKTIQRSSHEMNSSFYSTDQIPINSTYNQHTTIIGSSKLIRKINQIQDEVDQSKLKEIKSLVDGFKGLIQDAV